MDKINKLLELVGEETLIEIIEFALENYEIWHDHVDWDCVNLRMLCHFCESVVHRDNCPVTLLRAYFKGETNG
jgi:hypothetical protein